MGIPILFEGPEGDNGYLSNDYVCDFDVNGVTFPTMTHYMVYSKAKLFKDNATADRVLATADVETVKLLENGISGYNENIWVQNRETILYNGLKEKFSQDLILRGKLLATGMEQIGKTGLNDRIWGINLDAKDGKRLNKTNWRGMNLLGKNLMKLRIYIRNNG